jgi:hypothetical protein
MKNLLIVVGIVAGYLIAPYWVPDLVEAYYELHK